MSETFRVVKDGMAGPKEVARLRDLWSRRYAGELPGWYLRLWMWVHGWRSRPLVDIRTR